MVARRILGYCSRSVNVLVINVYSSTIITKAWTSICPLRFQRWSEIPQSLRVFLCSFSSKPPLVSDLSGGCCVGSGSPGTPDFQLRSCCPQRWTSSCKNWQRMARTAAGALSACLSLSCSLRPRKKRLSANYIMYRLQKTWTSLNAAPWSFSSCIIEARELHVFNSGITKSNGKLLHSLL